MTSYIRYSTASGISYGILDGDTVRALPGGLFDSLVPAGVTHKLADVKDGIATIDVTYQVLSPTDAAVELELVQRMQNGQVKFDIEKGRIQSQKMDVDKRIIGFAGPTSSMQYIMKM